MEKLGMEKLGMEKLGMEKLGMGEELLDFWIFRFEGELAKRGACLIRYLVGKISHFICHESIFVNFVELTRKKFYVAF